MGEAAAAIVPHEYKPRNPQQSHYYRCVEDHLESFELGYDERFSSRYGFLRPYVKDVMLRYLDCPPHRKMFNPAADFLPGPACPHLAPTFALTHNRPYFIV